MIVEIVGAVVIAVGSALVGFIMGGVASSKGCRVDDAGVMMTCDLGHRFSVCLIDLEINTTKVFACPVCSWWGRRAEVTPGDMIEYPESGGA
jgi:hypothetical protein